LLRFHKADGTETAGMVESDPLNVSAPANDQSPFRPEHRVIELRYRHPFTGQEIATCLHVPLETVKGWIRSGLIHLRKSW
jgi:hypothetical protein